MTWIMKAAAFIFFMNTLMGIFTLPQFNMWNKYYPSGNMYFNKTNMSVSLMTDSQASAYYGMDSNASINQSFTFTSIFNMNSSDVLGWLASVFIIVIQLFTFLLNVATMIFGGTAMFIIKYFGAQFAPFAIMIQGAISLWATYTVLQFLTARGGKVYD